MFAKFIAFLGVLALSAVVGFLCAVNNAGLISAGLLAIVTIIVGAAGLFERLKSAPRGAGGTQLEATPQDAPLSDALVLALGGFLLAISTGFSVGFWWGLCAKEARPERYGGQARIPAPWLSAPESRPIAEPNPGSTTVAAPKPDTRFELDHDLGWIALSDRLREMGWTEKDRSDFYTRHQCTPPPEPKPEQKPEAKPEQKPEAKPGQRPESKTENKAEPKENPKTKGNTKGKAPAQAEPAEKATPKDRCSKTHQAIAEMGKAWRESKGKPQQQPAANAAENKSAAAPSSSATVTPEPDLVKPTPRPKGAS